MKWFTTKVGITLVLALTIGTANAEVAAGNAISPLLNGTGCAAGAAGTEFASTTFQLNTPSVLFHNNLRNGDTIRHTATLSLRSAFANLPAACDDIPLTLQVTHTNSVIGSGLTLQQLDITDLGNTTVGQIKSNGIHTLTATLVVDTQNSNDMAINLSYLIPVTISLVTR